MYVRPGSSCSRPETSTRTPVVARISRDHVRAHQCAKYPRLSNRLEVIDSVPSTMVYRLMAGIRNRTVRHQWNDGRRTLTAQDAGRRMHDSHVNMQSLTR